jgi:glucosamine--fructose-6-phosphate aminotransferase (isomerizing)
MSGIVGLVEGRPVANSLLSAISRLADRGYEAAGLAVAHPGFGVRQVLGRKRPLDTVLGGVDGLMGHAGIAGTRWRTDGAGPAIDNPAVWGGIAVVRNGLVENQRELRAQLPGNGPEARDGDADCDETVIPRLIAGARAAGAGPREAVRLACARLHGAYAMAVLFEDSPGSILVATQGSPLTVARGASGAAVASDTVALEGLSDEFSELQDGDLAELSGGGVRILDRTGRMAERGWRRFGPSGPAALDGAFEYHTRGDIAGERSALARTERALRGVSLPDFVNATQRIVIVAAGSARHAAQAAQGWIERFTGLPCDVDSASAWRMREARPVPGTLGVVVSRSGETPDLLACQDIFRAGLCPTIAVTEGAVTEGAVTEGALSGAVAVGGASSRLARGADFIWPTDSGAERGFAVTKSFGAQMLALVRLGLAIAVARDTLPAAERVAVERALAEAATACALAEAGEARFAALACRIARANDAMLTGRGWAAAVAAEGALKLQLLAGVRAVAHESGELRGELLSLVRGNAPIIVCAASDRLLARCVVDVEALRACGAHVVAMCESTYAGAFASVAQEVIAMPGRGIANMFAQSVALHLIAYHTGIALGQDVDRPRHTATKASLA